MGFWVILYSKPPRGLGTSGHPGGPLGAKRTQALKLMQWHVGTCDVGCTRTEGVSHSISGRSLPSGLALLPLAPAAALGAQNEPNGREHLPGLQGVTQSHAGARRPFGGCPQALVAGSRSGRQNKPAGQGVEEANGERCSATCRRGGGSL
jgi:hypothetical protein